MTGRITKGIAGFYYVHDGRHLYECKAKGIFRKNHEKPLVGDHVQFSVISEEEKTGHIEEILPRKNNLIRPEIANVDQIFLQFSAASPAPNYDMLNRYLVMVHDREIPVHLVINKSELVGEEERQKTEKAFAGTCYPIHFISVKENAGIDEIRAIMAGKVTALAGPSGVGKSSLMNLLLGDRVMETGDLSRKIERGKNTTRHSELFFLQEDTFLFDTPGFSSVEVDFIEKEDLQYTFDEFLPFIPECRYLTSCKHMKERECDCAVKRAVKDGRIARERYDSYVLMFEHLADIRRY